MCRPLPKARLGKVQMSSCGMEVMVGHAQNLVVVLSHDAASLEGLASDQVAARQATCWYSISAEACHEARGSCTYGQRGGGGEKGGGVSLQPFRTDQQQLSDCTCNGVPVHTVR